MIALLLALSAAEPRILLDDIVASVNGDIVTRSELVKTARQYLDDDLPPERQRRAYRDILNELVNEKLLNQQVSEAGINVGEDQVDAAIADIQKTNGIDDDQLREALDARGVSWAAYRDQVRSQLVRMQLVAQKVQSRVVVPEADIRAEYEARSRREPPKVKVEISHIFLRLDEGAPAERRADVGNRIDALRRRVEAGEDFEELARAHSQGPTAGRGGSLGEMELSALMPELRSAVEKLGVGRISPPVLTPSGVHLVRLDQRVELPAKSYEELRDRIWQELRQRRSEEQMAAWIAELKRASSVDIRLD